MLRIVSATPDDGSLDISTNNFSHIVWPSKDGRLSTAKLAKHLYENGANDHDFILLTPSIEAITSDVYYDVRRVAKRSASDVSILLINQPSLPYYTGAGIVAVRLSALSKIDLQIDDYKQENRSILALAIKDQNKLDSIDIETETDIDNLSKLGVEDRELYDIDWYMNFSERWTDILCQYKRPTVDAQLAYLHMLSYRLIHNANGKNKYVLRDKNIDVFYDNVKKVLNYIDDEKIIDTPQSLVSLNKEVRLFLLKVKHPDLLPEFKYKKENIIRIFNKKQIDTPKKKPLSINSMDYFDDTLTIAGTYNFVFDSNDAHLVARYGESEVELEDTGIYSSYLLFGREIYRYPTFRLDIPKSKILSTDQIEFYLVANDQKTEIKLKLYFTRQMSKLSDEDKSYWYIESIDRIIKSARNTIFVTGGGIKRRVYNESRFIYSLISSKENQKLQAALIRVLLIIYKPLHRDTSWVFSDKPYKAGDNGEYLYNYSKLQSDGIKKHYILNKNCEDAKSLKKRGVNFIHYGSLRHKLIFLNSDIVFATHEKQPSHNSFMYDNVYLRDLYKYNTLFIQHGLTVQDLPQLLSKVVDNTKKYFVASHFEKDNLQKRKYGYKPSDIITSGVPRYDGLKSQSKKQIIITPTWRKYLANPGTGTGESRRKSESFKRSAYFNIYNRLINDEKLLATVEKNGYEIIFLLHPVTSSQKSDFDDHDERVKVLAPTDGVSYEKLLTESAIMVTDYSGVQFDFAYMKKPILYYHPDELPPTYDEAVFNYEKDSLGEIVDNHEKLVQKLCEYIDNGCKVPLKYKKRMDDFFYNNDYNNSERIYEEALRFQNNLK